MQAEPSAASDAWSKGLTQVEGGAVCVRSRARSAASNARSQSARRRGAASARASIACRRALRAGMVRAVAENGAAGPGMVEPGAGVAEVLGQMAEAGADLAISVTERLHHHLDTGSFVGGSGDELRGE